MSGAAARTGDFKEKGESKKRIYRIVEICIKRIQMFSMNTGIVINSMEGCRGEPSGIMKAPINNK